MNKVLIYRIIDVLIPRDPICGYGQPAGKVGTATSEGHVSRRRGAGLCQPPLICFLCNILSFCTAVAARPSAKPYMIHSICSPTHEGPTVVDRPTCVSYVTLGTWQYALAKVRMEFLDYARGLLVCDGLTSTFRDTLPRDMESTLRCL